MGALDHYGCGANVPSRKVSVKYSQTGVTLHFRPPVPEANNDAGYLREKSGKCRRWVRVTPKPVRTAVSNFFDYISYVDVIVNDFLQAKVQQGFSDVGRFLVNSTVGILGLFDVASELGMKPHQEDFGQTLGVWGSGEGAYLVYPILGPSTVRDTPGLVVSFVTNLLFYVGETAVVVPLTILAAIDARARAQGFFQFMDEAALDRYLFVREGYRQRRLFLIHDGRPLPRFPEEADDEALAPGRK
jgi:phospholipid-binding lipoprotein MlaA